MAKERNEKVEEFLNGPVEKEAPYLSVDASYYKVREVAGRYKTKALLTLARIGSLPMLHWKRIKTANKLEEVNKELKKRSRMIRAFPNEKSLMGLAMAIPIGVKQRIVKGKKIS